MRLTLRTLLAYLDDVLDPADKEELSQKIQSSDFAEDLVHKTRDTVRRLRLSAPQVIGSGMGLDPNSVAEYLDNVMPPDAVGDFERICLESDVHLAEAAACHHVLTMVLGQPADVDPISRQRMYSIATEVDERKKLRIEPAHASHSPAPAAAVAAVVMPGQPVRMTELAPAPRKIEIPEYLRAKSWWQSTSVLTTLAAVVLVGILVLFASGIRGWFGKAPSLASLTPPPSTSDIVPSETQSAAVTTEPATNSPQGGPVAESATASVVAPSPPLQPLTPSMPPMQADVAAKSTDADRATPAVTPSVGSPVAPAVPTASAPAVGLAGPANAPASGTVAAPTTAPAAAPAVSAAALPPVTTNEKSGAADNGSGPVAKNAVTVAAPPVVPMNPNAEATKPITPPAPTNPTANVPTSPVVPPTAAVTASTPPPVLSVESVPAGKSTTAPAPDAAAVAAATVAKPSAALEPENNGGGKEIAPAGPVELGTYIGGETVLLRYDGKAATWFRVEPRAAIVAGETILSLPEFRPKVAMVSGLHVDLSGGTAVIVNGEGLRAKSDADAASDSTGVPSIDVVYGRVVLTNPANGDKRVQLKLGGQAGEAQLKHNATLAVELERKHVPGDDPRKAPAPVECRLYAPDGGVVWKDGAGVKTIDKASRWTIVATGASDPVADTAPPEWIYNEPIGKLSEQRLGAPIIRKTIVSNQPADVQLLELFQQSKQKEVKSLVTRCTIHVGMFEPFVKALGDPEQKNNWKAHIDGLRSAMALSPESANKVWQTLVDQRGRPAAGDLFDMLCGYSADAIGHTPEQIKTGAIAQLIDRLEDNSLDYRVLAVQDLAEITGKRLMPNPAANQAERTLAIRKWRGRLDAGDLKPVVSP